MDWCYLGHASWLVDVDGARILFDPLLAETHHDGVFRVHPDRAVHEHALRPDVIVVTHRHPDHFDVESLHRLARRDPTSLVLTADAFVGRVCRALGFANVGVLDARTAVPLGDARSLYTTPSFTRVVEWGVIVTSPHGTAWNQVDTALRDPATIAAERARAADALGDPRLVGGVDLGVVRWSVMQQIEAVTGAPAGFPYTAYRAELERIAATGARVVVPGAAGECYVGDAAWLNRWAFPVSEARFLRDLARRCPDVRGTPGVVGGHWRIDSGEVHVDPTPDAALVSVRDTPDPRIHDPTSMPALADVRDTTASERARVRRWVTDALAPALPSVVPAGTVCALEVVWAHGADAWTLTSDRATPGWTDAWDLCNRIAGSDLVDVIDGRSHWGRPLLAGRLRIAHRLYDADLGRARRNPAFLYAPLSYDASTERWIAHEVAKRV